MISVTIVPEENILTSAGSFGRRPAIKASNVTQSVPRKLTTRLRTTLSRVSPKLAGGLDNDAVVNIATDKMSSTNNC